MADGGVLERIAAWESAGLIDTETAERLRAAEAERPLPSSPPSGARSAFGPTPTVAEVLGYVGGAFVLAAWFVLIGSQTSYAAPTWGTWLMAFGFAAVATIGIGVVLRDRGERGSRAAGVLFAVAVANAYGFGFNLAEAAAPHGDAVPLLVGGAVAVALGVGLRVRHPALTTQFALLGSVLSAALGIGAFVREGFLPVGVGSSAGDLVLDLVPWMVAAIVIGFLGLLESRTADEPAGRRASLSRFAAGLTVVVATASILTRTGPRGTIDEYGGYDYGRILEPFVADAAIAAVSLALLWLAFRRGTAAYLYPAALGIVIALTDLNGSYIADQVGTGVALLLEGLVILGAGLVADRVRRRLSRGVTSVG
jgi:hypothetical protein